MLSVVATIWLVLFTFMYSVVPSAAQDATLAQSDSVFIPQAKQAPAKRPPSPRPPAAPQNNRQTQSPAAPAIATKGPFPQGASSVSETYGDWTLNCTIDKTSKVCTLNQTQVSKETGQRAFAIELRTSKVGPSEGTILMPFGLKLENGASVRLDDKELFPALKFSTCLAQGCLVPLSISNEPMAAIRSAGKFTIAALTASDGQPVTFTVSLSGFATAFDRAMQLAS